MGNNAMMERAKELVVNIFNESVDKTEQVSITKENTFVVWFSKTLQNWKALVSTTVPDGKYYEVTHNGDKGETYVDVYVKLKNVCVPD